MNPGMGVRRPASELRLRIQSLHARRRAPRDDVVFEAGFFTRAKGSDRVAIIREDGAKMPADLGGNVHIALHDRTDISSIETRLRRFVEDAL
jgi:predicted nucleotide-binding protein